MGKLAVDSGGGAGGELANLNGKPIRKLLDKRAGHASRRASCPNTTAPNSAPTAKPATAIAVKAGDADTRQGGDLLHLLRELQRARHRPRPAEAAGAQRNPGRAAWRRKPAAACPSWNWATWTPWRSCKETNIPHLAKLAREGYAILTAVPSCTLMFKQELPLMFPDDAERAGGESGDVRSVRIPDGAQRDGLLKTDFKQPLGKVAYHVPCHQRVQNIGQKTRDALQLCRHRGDHGRALLRPRRHLGREEGEYFDKSMKIGKPVFQARWPSRSRITSVPTARLPARHIAAGHGRRHRRRNSIRSRCCASPMDSE